MRAPTVSIYHSILWFVRENGAMKGIDPYKSFAIQKPFYLFQPILRKRWIPKWYIRPAAAVKHAFLMRERRKAVRTMIAPHAAFPNAAKRQMVVG